MSADTGGAVARGAVWMLLARGVDRLGGIVSIAITARYLSPADFGTFQMALSVIALVEVFSLLGFEWAMVRHPNPTREHFDTAFTLQLMCSAAATVLILALAYPFAAYYRTPELVNIVLVMACTPLMWGFNNMALVHLRREYRFERDFWRMFMPRVVSLVTTIGLAIWWQSYWALILGLIATKAMQLASGYLLHPYRPRLSLLHWRELMGFSVWLQLSAIIDGLRTRIADLVVGRLEGSHSLAIFNMTTELANLPQGEFVGAINSAVFPKYGRLQGDIKALRGAYVDILSLTFLAGLPFAVGLAFTAQSAVLLLLGAKWVEVIPVIQFVAFGAFAYAVGGNTPFVLISAGRPNINAALGAGTLVVLLVMLILLTSRMGINGAALGFTIASFLVLPVHFLILRKSIGLSLREVWPRVWRSLVAVVVMWGALHLVAPDMQATTSLDAAWRLAIAAGIGGAVYAAAVVGLWNLSGRPQGVEQLLINAARDITTRVGQRVFKGG